MHNMLERNVQVEWEERERLVIRETFIIHQYHQFRDLQVSDVDRHVVQ